MGANFGRRKDRSWRKDTNAMYPAQGLILAQGSIMDWRKQYQYEICERKDRNEMAQWYFRRKDDPNWINRRKDSISMAQG